MYKFRHFNAVQPENSRNLILGAVEVIAEMVAREQPEHLKEYFIERLAHYRQVSQTLRKSSDLRYIDMAEANKK